MQASQFLLTETDTTIVTAFFNADKQLDSEALRCFALETLQKLAKRSEQCISSAQCSQQWRQVDDRAVVGNHKHWTAGYNQVQELGTAIAFWIKEAVESEQRWNFFVLEKATEISSGDRDRDYYHALMIRHDQILAACLVLEQAVMAVEQSCQLSVDALLQSEAMRFLARDEIETTIFAKAETFLKQRLQLGYL